jgi:hypothetical protein
MATNHRLRPIYERAPLAAFALIKHAIANQGLSKHGGFGEHAVLVSLALSVPALAPELAAVYQRARSVGTAHHEHHLDLARAALRLGRRDAAIAHVARTLHYSGLYWGVTSPKASTAANRLHVHEGLASLHGDPAFEQLFVEDAARRAAAIVPDTAAKAKQARKTKLEKRSV